MPRYANALHMRCAVKKFIHWQIVSKFTVKGRVKITAAQQVQQIERTEFEL